MEFQPLPQSHNCAIGKDTSMALDYHSIVAFGSGFQDLIEKLNHQLKLVDIVRVNHRSSIGSSILLKMAENV